MLGQTGQQCLWEKALMEFNKSKDIEYCLSMASEAVDFFNNAIQHNPNCESFHSGLYGLKRLLTEITF